MRSGSGLEDQTCKKLPWFKPKVHVEDIDFGTPCPLQMKVDIHVLNEHDPPNDTEWNVCNWYNGNVCQNSCTAAYHDGRNQGIMNLLWNMVLWHDHDTFVAHVSDLLSRLIMNSAEGKTSGSNAHILNVRCKHGRHRSLGWACLTTQVLLLYGVRVKIVIGRERLCPCNECNRPINRMNDDVILRKAIEERAGIYWNINQREDWNHIKKYIRCLDNVCFTLNLIPTLDYYLD